MAGQVRTEDAFAWALRLLQAAALEPTYELANQAVEGLLSRRSEVEVRDIAAALALLPRLSKNALDQMPELDRLVLSFQWAYSE